VGKTGDDGVEIFKVCTMGDNEFVGCPMLVDVAVYLGSWDGALVVPDGCTTGAEINVAGEVDIRVDLAVGGGSDDATPHAHNTRAVHAVAKIIRKLQTILGNTIDGRFNPVNIRIMRSINVRAIIDRYMSVPCLLEEVYTETCGFVQLLSIL
jgi:hypothetical protein